MVHGELIDALYFFLAPVLFAFFHSSSKLLCVYREPAQRWYQNKFCVFLAAVVINGIMSRNIYAVMGMIALEATPFFEWLQGQREDDEKKKKEKQPRGVGIFSLDDRNDIMFKFTTLINDIECLLNRGLHELTMPWMPRNWEALKQRIDELVQKTRIQSRQTKKVEEPSSIFSKGDQEKYMREISSILELLEEANRPGSKWHDVESIIVQWECFRADILG